MPTLVTDLRNKLEKTVTTARNLGEKAAKAALETLAVHHHEPYGHMTVEQRKLRNQLRARARQAGDVQDGKGVLSIKHLAHECAYEHWHRMLFARFLAENNLLIEPDSGVAISLDECKELAKAEKTDLWTLAGRYAQKMLPEVFRADDPLLKVTLAREDQLKLEQLLDSLTPATFTAGDSLGWCYQFWQTEWKKAVNDSGDKIGADELPAVTQLFTEDYMVDFLLDNTLGAWWAGKKMSEIRGQKSEPKTEDEARKAVALPGCPWKYLRFIKDKDGKWQPAAGTFDGWPKTAKELKCLDPCMGSGHFVVAMFERLIALRMAEEKLAEKAAVEAVIRDNLFGLEIDPRCTQIGAFNLALAAWRRVGHCPLPAMHLACSGLAIGVTREEWIRILADEGPEATPFRFFFGQLYDLFQKAPVLGSLINPKRFLGSGMLSREQMNRLMLLLGRAIELTTSKPESHELGVAAQGIAKAAEILAGQFTLVATNVPYLGRGKQEESLQDYCERVYPEAKADLATCFVERCLQFCAVGGNTALVTPQNWLFLGTYKSLRRSLLETIEFNSVARLGPRGFQTPMFDFNIILISLSRLQPLSEHQFSGIDVGDDNTPEDKAHNLVIKTIIRGVQKDQLRNPDGRLILGDADHGTPLGEFASSIEGLTTGDMERFLGKFWEHPAIPKDWEVFVQSVDDTCHYGGRSDIILWEKDAGALRASPTAHNFPSQFMNGKQILGKRGIRVTQMPGFGCTLYLGEVFGKNAATVVPHDLQHLPAIWCFVCSSEFRDKVRKIDQALKVTNATFTKVPFDLTHWQTVAAKKYPHGLPKPFSNDPTQWLFNGHPKLSNAPLHVAVARLLDYRWPRQAGYSFPDCPALDEDGALRCGYTSP